MNEVIIHKSINCTTSGSCCILVMFCRIYWGAR